MRIKGGCGFVQEDDLRFHGHGQTETLLFPGEKGKRIGLA